MNPITEAREHVCSVLAGLGIPAHPYPPATPTPPQAVLVWGYPYYQLRTLGGRAAIGLEVQISVNAVAGPDAGQTLDELTTRAVDLLTASATMTVDAVSAPTIDPDTALLAARIPITLEWKE